MKLTENGQEFVNNYKNIFQTFELPAISIVKAKIIQALIQIERPMNWNREKLLDTIKDLINVERYNAVVSRTINKFNLKWNIFENLN
jgi:predicted transcriptional regulator